MNEFYPDNQNNTNQDAAPVNPAAPENQNSVPDNFNVADGFNAAADTQVNRSDGFNVYVSPDDNTEPEKAETGTAPSGYTFTSDGSYRGRPDNSSGAADMNGKTGGYSNPASYTPPTYTYGQTYNGYSAGAPIPPAPSKKEKAKKKFSFASLVAVAVIAAIIGTSGGVLGFAVSNKLTGGNQAAISDNSGSGLPTQNISINTTTDSVVEAVAQKCSPSVVGIRTTTTINSFFGNQESAGEGSGIIYTSDGYIITNYHVIEDAAKNSGVTTTRVDVFLTSDPETAIPAAIVGYNISYDLAVIKIDKTGLPAIEIGNSDEVKVGQYAIAIGNPGGLSFMGSVSYGIVSGLSRTLESSGSSSTDAAQYIQTDAAINPGNSGGALVNAKGQLIGVNSVKLVASGFEGMGFAIPSNKAVEICQDIINNENEPEPYLGVQISTRYDAATLQMYGYPTGAVVSSVDSGSPAETAGLQRGDIITVFNGVEISDYTEFKTQITQCKVGSSVDITIYRGGRYYNATVTIGSNS